MDPDALWCDTLLCCCPALSVPLDARRAGQSSHPQRSTVSSEYLVGCDGRQRSLAALLGPATTADDLQTRLKNRQPDQTAHPRDHIPVYLHNGNSSASTTTTTSSTATTTSTSACPSANSPNLAPIEHPPRPASARRGHDRGGPCHLVLHPRRDDDRRRPDKDRAEKLWHSSRHPARPRLAESKSKQG